ncbi:MAG: 30S ribosomal protein S4 [Chloroflexi bacterium]|nr:30S ribosomal protein S4 [Chloroflexota bacterium]
MAREIGPVCRLCRRSGEKLFLKGSKCFTNCTLEQRNSPPGQHGARRRKLSERGAQLREKQKVRYIYGILERQFRRHYAEAERRPGITGENLLQFLELRLDNVVYRLGYADSRAQARHLVNHGHITLNGHKTDAPSARVKVGSVVGWNPASLNSEYYKLMVRDIQGKAAPPWLSRDPQTLSGRVLYVPTRAEIDTKVNEQAIVEYYSR